MWLEESHDRSYEVPGEVDGSKEADGLDSDAVGEQHPERMEQTCIFTFRFGCLATCFPFTRLIELAL